MTSPQARDVAVSLTVGMIAPPWLPVPPVGYGGTEGVLDTLARGLQSAGHRVVLFSTGDATCPVPRAWYYPQALGVGHGGAVQEARHVVEAYEQLRGVDVIHDHTTVGPLYARGLADRVVVATNHGPFNDELTAVYRAVADRVGVIAISHNQASTADGLPLAGVIHHGIDVTRVPVGDGAGGYALFLGRMHPDKGVDTAMSAARAAGVPLRIAAKMSEPHERENFETAIAPRLGHDIEFLGEVGGSDKLRLLGSATCLLNPIRWAEPFGMVMIEALACGTPVVATGCGSAGEIVDHGETGFVCDDQSSLARAVVQAGGLDRARCRAVAETRFSSARMVADHVALYRRALERAESGRGAGEVMPSRTAAA